MFNETLKFLNKISNKKPKENSKPANPSIKKVLLIKFMSSFKEATKREKQYKDSHVTSEKNNKEIKLEGLNRKEKRLNQKINIQKFIHNCTNKKTYNSIISLLLTETWFSKKL